MGTTSDARLQPSYNTNPLQDLYIMAVDQRFDLPNNVLVLLTEENESRASNVALCVKFIDSIIEHDRALARFNRPAIMRISPDRVCAELHTPASEGAPAQKSRRPSKPAAVL